MKQTNLLKGILAIVALLCSTHAWAYDFGVDNIRYTVISLDELTVEVSGLSDESVIEVVIPETVEYRGRTLMVTSIGNYAFCDCIRPESVTIPNSVKKISGYAFSGCSGLMEITIPNSVIEISSYAFNGCIGLAEVTIPNSVIEIGDYAFSDCSRLTEVTIGESLTTIGDYAFSGCMRLTEVNFNATACTHVLSSSSYSYRAAFCSCSNISTFNFGDNITIIPDYLCYNLTELTQIAIPNSVTTIGSSAFRECTGLTGTLTIPKSVTEIGSYAFYNCSGLTEITIPESVTEIGGYAFYNCSGLTSVTIPESMTKIGSYTFYGCSSLKELDIPNSVTSLGNHALEGCTNLEKLQIGTGMNYLRDYYEYVVERESSGNGYFYNHRVYYYPVLWKDGPSIMEGIILKDGTANFSVRGYGKSSYPSYPMSGYPIFSNISVQYYYVGRPLIDIDAWTNTYYWEITTSRPYGLIKTLEIGGYCTEVPYFYQSVDYLVLGENVETYEAGNIYQGNLKAIICRSAVPPTLSGTFMNNNYLNTIVYVPIGSKATYEATEGWKSFWDIQELDMQSIPPGYDAVESALAEKGTPDVSVSDGSIVVNGAKGETIHVYNMQGQQIYSGHDAVIPVAHHGIYIVNVAGKSKKVSL